MLQIRNSGVIKINALRKIDFNDLLRDTLFELRHIWPESRSCIAINVAQQEPFLGDARYLGLIIKQLLLNTPKRHNSYKNDPYLRLNVRVENGMAFIELNEKRWDLGSEREDKSALPMQHSKFTTGHIGSYVMIELVEQLEGSVTIVNNDTGETIITLVLPNKSNLITL